MAMDSNNYVYYRDDDGYKTVVGITRNEDNIDKILNVLTRLNLLKINNMYFDESLDFSNKKYEIRKPLFVKN